jgi:hypothetical protein
MHANEYAALALARSRADEAERHHARRREQEERPAQWAQPYTELRSPFVMPEPRRATVRPARP